MSLPPLSQETSCPTHHRPAAVPAFMSHLPVPSLFLPFLPVSPPCPPLLTLRTHLLPTLSSASHHPSCPPTGEPHPHAPNSHLHPVLARDSLKPRNKTSRWLLELSIHGASFPWMGPPPQLCTHWSPRGDPSLLSQLALQASHGPSSANSPPGSPEGQALVMGAAGWPAHRRTSPT